MPEFMRRRSQTGFSLIEVITVVAIVGIIAAIALPSYSGSIAKTRRGAAQGCLNEFAQFLERNFTLSLRYDEDPNGAAIALPGLQCATDLNGIYAFAPVLTQTTYALTADPSSKQESADASCGCNLTLNQQGIKGVTGCGKAVSACW